MDALAETAGVKKIDDYNGESQEGASVIQQNVANGLRYSSSVAYLDDHGLPNLAIQTNTRVTKVIIEGGRATDVEILENGDPSRRQVITAIREVILSAGVFNTPQLLMLSGVGPAEHLKSVGVDVKQDLPVGDNLHDHLFVPMTYVMKSAVHHGSAPYFFKGIIAEELKGDTWLGRTVFESFGFVRSSIAGEIPDIQLHALPWSYPFPNQDSPKRWKVDPRSSLTLFSTLIYPKSRGTVRLASSSPLDKPVIDMGYLSHPDDAKVLIDGMELIRETMSSSLVAPGVTEELNPGGKWPDRAAMEKELPNWANSVYHGVGTCRMGGDERAVVDPELKVRGIEGLRVADCSIMPSIVGGNTNAPAMMIGEHAASLILGQ
jgi:choline dehydrogenase-like flavoprotein